MNCEQVQIFSQTLQEKIEQVSYKFMNIEYNFAAGKNAERSESALKRCLQALQHRKKAK